MIDIGTSQSLEKFNEQLIGLRDDIDLGVTEFFDADADASLENTEFFISDQGQYANRLLREFSLRPGKRIRGALTMIGYEMFGGSDAQVARTAAVAIELTQNYLLIIDDVMDRSDSRRGGETVHMHYRTHLLQDLPNAARDHASNMLAINIGLIAQHKAARLLGSVGAEPALVVRALDTFHKNIAATCYGQLDDLWNTMDVDSSEADSIRTYELKTSYYTFINPLQTGAVLAGATDADLAVLQEFGLHAGLAFQLQDDVIGMFGVEKTSGKSALDDLREGKVTVLMKHALSHASDADAEVLRAALGNPDVTEHQHLEVQRILESTGSREYSLQKALAEARAAHSIVRSQVNWDPESCKFLENILQYIVERES